MRVLKIKEKDTQEQTELVFNSYRDCLEDVMDSNINNGLAGKNNHFVKQST